MGLFRKENIVQFLEEISRSEGNPNEEEEKDPDATDYTQDLENDGQDEPDDVDAEDYSLPEDNEVDETEDTAENPPEEDNAETTDYTDELDDEGDTLPDEEEAPTDYTADIDADGGGDENVLPDEETPTDYTDELDTNDTTDEGQPEGNPDTPDTTPNDPDGEAPDYTEDLGGDIGGDETGGDNPEETDKGDDGGKDTTPESPTSGGDPEIKEMEDKLFSSLTPEQMNIRVQEQKKRFINLYGLSVSAGEKINNILKTTDNMKVIEFLIKKLNELSTMVNDYIIHTYDTLSYTENESNFTHFLFTLSEINKVIEEIGSEKASV